MHLEIYLKKMESKKKSSILLNKVLWKNWPVLKNSVISILLQEISWLISLLIDYQLVHLVRLLWNEIRPKGSQEVVAVAVEMIVEGNWLMICWISPMPRRPKMKKNLQEDWTGMLIWSFASSIKTVGSCQVIIGSSMEFVKNSILNMLFFWTWGCVPTPRLYTKCTTTCVVVLTLEESVVTWVSKPKRWRMSRCKTLKTWTGSATSVYTSSISKKPSKSNTTSPIWSTSLSNQSSSLSMCYPVLSLATRCRP